MAHRARCRGPDAAKRLPAGQPLLTLLLR
ncbi:hypothetical protein SPHINGO8AM_60126 [Sphingomonas sp. 8AM]|nr:hypothetical protein SPHINGO8AM_60126 [Sphingomonas sp. 8AM]